MADAPNFHSPIEWLPADQMKVELKPDNSVAVELLAADRSLNATAFMDGTLVWRPSGAGPDIGNLELVLSPGKWARSLAGTFSAKAWRELPPGRVLYLGLPWETVKGALDKLIKQLWTSQAGAGCQGIGAYSPLGFIPVAGGKADDRLCKRLAAPGPGVQDAVVDGALDAWRQFKADKPQFGIPIRAGTTITLSPAAGTALQFNLEIRNLYGEPLNPFYYLNLLTPNEVPQAVLSAGRRDEPRYKTAGQAIKARALKTGGAQYRLMNQKLETQTGGTPYRSRLVWEYAPAGTAFAAQAKARPEFNNVVPAALKDQTIEITASWNYLKDPINTYGELFNVPAELMLALIHVESRKQAGKPDLHSFRFEPVQTAYPADHVALRKALADSPGSYHYTEKALLAFAKLAGGGVARSNSNDVRDTLWRPKDKQREFALPGDANLQAKLGPKGPRSEITWEMLGEIASIKPDLIAGLPLKLPPLGTTTRKKVQSYHYDLLLQAGISEALLQAYWRAAGGSRKKAGTSNSAETSPAGADPGKTLQPTLPFLPDAVVLTGDGVHPAGVTWKQLQTILEALRANGVKAPKITFRLNSFRVTEVDKATKIKEAVQARYGALPNLDDLVKRYISVQEKLMEWVASSAQVNEPHLRDVKHAENYLTIAETKQLSKLYEHRMSLGIEQTLFSTARDVIAWLRDHYGEDFFTQTAQASADPPPDPDRTKANDAMIDWIWQEVWDKEALQVVLLAGYIKQEAITDWRAAGGKRHYAVGERMTMYDLARVAAAYNAGHVKAPSEDKPPPSGQKNNPENKTDWGFTYYGNYVGSGEPGAGHGFGALNAAFTMLSTPAAQPSVRLYPDLEPGWGMNAE